MQISAEFSLFPYFSPGVERFTRAARPRGRRASLSRARLRDTPFPTGGRYSLEKGEITEIRKECETERRTLNGIRIGRVPSISSRYYVIAPFLPARRRDRETLAECTHLACRASFVVFLEREIAVRCEEKKFSREKMVIV